MHSRRRFLQGAATAAAVAAVGSKAVQGQSEPTGLATPVFQQLPLGAVKPAGWLRTQMLIQANGMSGHLDEFWPDVGPNSGWLGGTGESWERGPYFLDGLLPLAVELEDPRLMEKAKKFVNWTLTNQQSNGMIGPKSNDDWWPRMVMVKCLQQWAEATGDPRVEPVLTKYFHYQLAELPGRPLKDWGKFRWQDEVYVIQWLYDRTHDAKLLELSTLLRKQGFDWTGFFGPSYPFTTKADKDWSKGGGLTDHALSSHGVNNGQGLKTAAVQYRMTGNDEEHGLYANMVAKLDRYHGMPSGMFSCDEHLAGLEPQQGTELCTVVETMFSMELALSAFGDPMIADRVEKIAYNALPGTFRDDMWSHQYDQEPNQLNVGIIQKPFPWTSDGPQSNMFGLEPHFGCCTANYHQGWPKFTANLWMRTRDGKGLVSTLLAPSVLSTKVGGTDVTITTETEYPFRPDVKYVVAPAAATAFPLCVRIPAWVDAPVKVRVNGKTAATGKPGEFVEVARTWKQGDVVEMTLPMQTKLVRGFQRSVSLERGPLVFSLNPGEQWTKLRDRGMTADWQASITEPWNYALDLDEAGAAKVKVEEQPVGAVPFGKAQPPVSLKVQGKVVPEWTDENKFAKAPPASPVKSSSSMQELTLIPYGAAKLRVTSFPSLRS